MNWSDKQVGTGKLTSEVAQIWKGIGFGVDTGDGVALCRAFNRVITGSEPPRHLNSDHDRLFEYTVNNH